jgi:hypothetical protein
MVLRFGEMFNYDPDEEIFFKAFKYTEHCKLKGDYLEFGIWKGRTFSKAYHTWEMIKRKNKSSKSVKFWAFDSFQGLPEISCPIDKETGEFFKGDYRCGEDTFKKILINNKIAPEQVNIIPGWFNESLDVEKLKKIGLAHAAVILVDCDLYASAVSVLNFITDFIQNGTVIIFHDWFVFRGDPDRGEQRAFREWLSRNPNIKAVEWQKTNWSGNSFILSVHP